MKSNISCDVHPLIPFTPSLFRKLIFWVHATPANNFSFYSVCCCRLIAIHNYFDGFGCLYFVGGRGLFLLLFRSGSFFKTRVDSGF
jgi:hypothetical protein